MSSLWLVFAEWRMRQTVAARGATFEAVLVSVVTIYTSCGVRVHIFIFVRVANVGIVSYEVFELFGVVPGHLGIGVFSPGPREWTRASQ